MDNQDDTKVGSKPTASVTVTFLSAENGGREMMPSFNATPSYRPHIVVQDPTIRHPSYGDDGMNNEHYMGVEFVDGPNDASFNVPLKCTLRFTYFPRVDYSTATEGETFTVREGARIVAHGTLNSVSY